MVDELTAFASTSAGSKFEIRSDNVLCEDGRFTEGGLVENMAQTVALFAGKKAQESAPDSDPPVGFIAGIKGLEIKSLPEIGQTLQTEIEIVNEVMNIQIAQATVQVSDEVVASCEMRIFIQE